MVKIDFKLVREKSVEAFWSYSHFRKKKKKVLRGSPANSGPIDFALEKSFPLNFVH